MLQTIVLLKVELWLVLLLPGLGAAAAPGLGWLVHRAYEKPPGRIVIIGSDMVRGSNWKDYGHSNIYIYNMAGGGISRHTVI